MKKKIILLRGNKRRSLANNMLYLYIYNVYMLAIINITVYKIFHIQINIIKKIKLFRCKTNSLLFV